jgi:hypothetical protein
MQKVYLVQVKGWGDSADRFYVCGAFSTREKAEAHVETLLAQWEEDGEDRAEVVYEIEPVTVDAV